MKVFNKTFSRNFEEVESFEAGIALTGAEAKSVSEGRIKLEQAYVKIIDRQPWLINAEIFKYKYASGEYEATRRRKLLLHKKEITRLLTKIQSGGNLTIVPVSCYNKRRTFKLKIALVRGRKDTQKRRLEKDKKVKRDQEKMVKEYMKK
jgi:SsrA-binding protein